MSKLVLCVDCGATIDSGHQYGLNREGDPGSAMCPECWQELNIGEHPRLLTALNTTKVEDGRRVWSFGSESGNIAVVFAVFVLLLAIIIGSGILAEFGAALSQNAVFQLLMAMDGGL